MELTLLHQLVGARGKHMYLSGGGNCYFVAENSQHTRVDTETNKNKQTNTQKQKQKYVALTPLETINLIFINCNPDV